MIELKLELYLFKNKYHFSCVKVMISEDKNRINQQVPDILPRKNCLRGKKRGCFWIEWVITCACQVVLSTIIIVKVTVWKNPVASSLSCKN